MSHARERGVTLTELVVAVGIFSVLAVVVGSLFLSVSRLQRRALRDARVVDNARFAMETIARTLRTVPSAAITPAGDTATDHVVFAHTGKIGGLGCLTAPCLIQYDLKDGAIVETDGTQGPFPLTSAAVEVSDFQIFFAGRAVSDSIQPRATIVLAVRDRSDPANAEPLRVQTTVSLRPLDFE